MLSRVAESIYWMSRYVERAENVARFIEVNLHLILDLPMHDALQWQPLVTTSGDDADFEKRYGKATQENVVFFLTFDTENPNSILSCLRKARENARTVREVISSEMWEQLNGVFMQVRDAATTAPSQEFSNAIYDRIKTGSHLFCGLTDNTFSHGEGWHFAQLGRFIERADKTARMLDVRYFILLPDLEYVGSTYDNLLWSALLRSASAFEMYRQRFGRIDPQRVAEFLVTDWQFPRSLRFCAAAAEESLRAITGSPPGTFKYDAERRLGGLRSELDYAQISEIMAGGLHEFLDEFETKLNRVDQQIYEAFFMIRQAPAGQAAGTQ